MKDLFLLCFLCCATSLSAQTFILGGGGLGIGPNPTLNSIVDKFNTENEHDLGSFTTAPGYEIGLIHYAKRTVIEMKWGGEGKRNSSKVPGNFIENATVAWRYHYLNFSFGIRPFETKFLTAGLGLNFGRMRTRYSFGGDFQVANAGHSLSTEIFVDYALKVRWRRGRDPYMFRIRPYFQYFLLPVDLKVLEQELNLNEEAQFNQYVENFSNIGIRFILMIPLKRKEKVKKEKKDPLDRKFFWGKLPIPAEGA